MIGHSRGYLAAINAAMMLNASAAVAMRPPVTPQRGRTIMITEGDTVKGTVTIDRDMRRDLQIIERESAMYGNGDRSIKNRNEHSHGGAVTRANLKALERRQQADTKISAAQAKRDRKAAKRAATVSA